MILTAKNLSLKVGLFTLGLISILGQVVVLRELAVAFYGVELIYLLALGIWLLWTASGSLSSRRTDPSPLQTCSLFLLFSFLLPLTVVCIRSTRLWWAPAPGAYLSFTAQVLVMSLFLLPIGFLLGWLFQWSARAFMRAEGTLALAYAIESAGGVVGGLLSTLFLKVGIQNFVIAVLCSLFSLGAALLLIWGTRIRWLTHGLALALAVLLLTLWQAPLLDQLSTSWNHPQLVATRDTPYSRVTISQLAGQISVFENDALAFETEGTQAEEFVHLAAIQHPAPKAVLILGGGIEGIVEKVLEHSPEQVDYVELNPCIPQLVLPILPSQSRAAFQDKRVTVTIADPRSFLARDRHYDLILVAMPEPTSGQSNRFYTREFFQQCANRLNPAGVLAFRLRSSENLWTPSMLLRMSSIFEALNEVFRSITVLPGATNILIGSQSDLPRDPVELGMRFASRNLRADLVSLPYIRYLYTNDRFQQIRTALTSTVAPVNTDALPICYQYTLMIWLSKFFPDIATLNLSPLSEFFGKADILWHPAWLALPVVLWICRRWKLCRSSLLAGIAGFAGMVLETVLLLRYQTKNGALFEDLGVLLMAFMAGLAMGAAGINRLSGMRLRTALFRKVAGGVLTGAFVLQSLLLGKTESPALGGLGGISAALFLTGLLVSGLFAVASLQTASAVHDQKSRAVGPLYAADLFGGCLGSLLSSLVLIPFAGLATTARLLVPLLLSAVALL